MTDQQLVGLLQNHRPPEDGLAQLRQRIDRYQTRRASVMTMASLALLVGISSLWWPRLPPPAALMDTPLQRLLDDQPRHRLPADRTKLYQRNGNVVYWVDSDSFSSGD